MMYRIALLLCFLVLLSGCTLADGGVTVTPTPSLPSVSFQAPQNNQQVYEGTDMIIDLLATDSVQGISRIDLFIDTFTDEPPTNSASPVDGTAVPAFAARMNWLAQGTGFHRLTAIAYRADGLQSDETTIVVEVIPRAGN